MDSLLTCWSRHSTVKSRPSQGLLGKNWSQKQAFHSGASTHAMIHVDDSAPSNFIKLCDQDVTNLNSISNVIYMSLFQRVAMLLNLMYWLLCKMDGTFYVFAALQVYKNFSKTISNTLCDQSFKKIHFAIAGQMCHNTPSHHNRMFGAAVIFITYNMFAKSSPLPKYIVSIFLSPSHEISELLLSL